MLVKRLPFEEACFCSSNQKTVLLKFVQDTMNVSVWIGIVAAILVAIVLFPALAALWRRASAITHSKSPEFRLSIPNLWTEIQHVKDRGSNQMMKMEDGEIILLSVGLDTTKVFVTPRLDSVESFSEVASFPMARLGDKQHIEGEVILKKLRTAIGWPKSVNQLRQTLSRLAEQEFSLVEPLN